MMNFQGIYNNSKYGKKNTEEILVSIYGLEVKFSIKNKIHHSYRKLINE